MPTFWVVPRDIFLALGVTKNEAIFGQKLMNDAEEFSFFHHIFVFIDENAVFFEADIDGETSVVLAKSWGSNGSLSIFEAILLFEA